MVALGDLGFELAQLGHGEAPLGQVLGPAAGALSHRGREEHLELRIGEHGGADVAAFGHQATPGPHGLLLAGEGRAHAAMGRHHRHLASDLRATDRLGHVLAVDRYPLRPLGAGAELEIEVQQQASHGVGIGWINAGRGHQPGDGPIHGAGVEVNQAEAGGKGLGHGAFAGPGGAIDGNDRRAAHQKHMVN